MGASASSDQSRQVGTKAASASSSCPVDPAAREAWLTAAKAKEGRGCVSAPSATTDDKNDQSYAEPQRRPKDPRRQVDNKLVPQLDEHRVISSIPRAATSPLTVTPSPNSPKSTRPNTDNTNTKITSKHEGTSEKWIYPSEKMFFEAMRRKAFDPQAKDMQTIVPIHNAVNERAWQEILAWEASSSSAVAASKPCNGPLLRSFSGDSTKLTPRARWYGLLGYERPFDRHDWVIERCNPSNSVEYVIDFYRGKGGLGGLSFYLDVRPKLNSYEGWRMRARRLFSS